jgi:hypothetical protein
MLSEDEMQRIVETVRPYTMVADDGIKLAMRATIHVIQSNIPGALVECGVWRGGCSAALLLAQRAVFGRVVRPVYMLDSFEGLPPVDQRDGPLAAAYQRQEYAEYLDNCRAGIEEAQAALDTLGLQSDDYALVKGWFDETVPPLAASLRDQGVAMLRLDGDWYDSTMTCLSHLEPLVSAEGMVLIDDYFEWDGCARAIHDYLSRNDLAYRIQSAPNLRGAYFTKRTAKQAGAGWFV